MLVISAYRSAHVLIRGVYAKISDAFFGDLMNISREGICLRMIEREGGGRERGGEVNRLPYYGVCCNAGRAGVD